MQQNPWYVPEKVIEIAVFHVLKEHHQRFPFHANAVEQNNIVVL